MKIEVGITPDDWLHARTGDPSAGLLARSLSRELGGRWRVVGDSAFEQGLMGRRLRLSDHAQGIMQAFGAGHPVHDTQTTVYGNLRSRRGPARPRTKRSRWGYAAAGGGTLGSIVLIEDGWGWLLLTGIAGAVAGIFALRRHRKRPAGHTASRSPQRSGSGLPSVRDLRSMPPAERRRVLDSAAAQTIGEPAPEPSPPPAPPVREPSSDPGS